MTNPTVNPSGRHPRSHVRLVVAPGPSVTPVDDHVVEKETARPLGRAPLIARGLGAIALLVVGGLHLEQYIFAYFSVIPTIGPLFLLNFLGATALGLVLLVPLRVTPGTWRLATDSGVAVAGIALATGAFAGLLISEHTPLFGFMEHGYRIEVAGALAAEAVAIVSLGTFLAGACGRLRELHAETASTRLVNRDTNH